jgi:hypothetical protein
MNYLYITMSYEVKNPLNRLTRQKFPGSKRPSTDGEGLPENREKRENNLAGKTE